MMKFLLPAIAAISLAAPAAAVTTLTVQTRSFTLTGLTSGPITARQNTFANFNSFNLAGQRLLWVSLLVESDINAEIVATNNATGGTGPSRRRDMSATAQLDAATTGMGFNLTGSNSMTDTVLGVAGNGTVRTLGQLDPAMSLSSTQTSNLSGFLSGQVRVFTDVAALFTTVPANSVVYGSPSISGGRTRLTLTYASAVPEAGTWAMMIAGFGLVGAARRRRTAIAA
jgi:hypothetical protein